MIGFHTIGSQEIGIPVRDVVHPWKSGYICVVGHPFFEVTGSSGAFRLDGLVPGTYVIESWHEKLGTKQQTVTVKADEAVKIIFKY